MTEAIIPIIFSACLSSFKSPEMAEFFEEGELLSDDA
jgi:hypothetical protein